MTHRWMLPEKKFCFIAVPKCGSTSILGTIFRDRLREAPEPEVYHAGISQVLKKHPEVESYFKCGFVRNPWDRIVSGYYNGIQAKDHIQVWSSGLSKYKSFSHFVLDLPNSYWKEWVHFAPCSNFLTVDGEVAVDFVGRMETFEDNYIYLCDKLGVTSPFKSHDKDILENAKYISHARKSLRKAGYRKYYNSKTKEIIRELYKEDIERFGYEF